MDRSNIIHLIGYVLGDGQSLRCPAGKSYAHCGLPGYRALVRTVSATPPSLGQRPFRLACLLGSQLFSYISFNDHMDEKKLHVYNHINNTVMNLTVSSRQRNYAIGGYVFPARLL